VSIPAGDPVSIRLVAGRLRLEAADLTTILARTSAPTALPRNRGAFADQRRDAAASLRERAAWIATRLEGLAIDLDRGANWLEQAQIEARATELAGG
jgi:hypothetical protein